MKLIEIDDGKCIYNDFIWCPNSYECDKCDLWEPKSVQSIEPKQLSIFDKDKVYNILINERDYGKKQFLKNKENKNG